MSRYRNKGKQRNEKTSKEIQDEKKDSSVSTTKVPEESQKEPVKAEKHMIPSAANDPEWYSRDQRLVVDGASIPFSTPFGGKLDFLDPARTTMRADLVTPELWDNTAIPGICSVILKPSFGVSVDKTSPINVCANALYTHVRYVNSGRKNYDPVDLFMYAACFGDIYSFLCWCIRIYHYAFMYSQRNFYIGKDLLIANGVIPEDIIANLANFRYWINSIINKISSFCLPGDIYFFKRRVFLYSNYYIENGLGNLKDQMYQLVPEGFYCFDFDSNGAGILKYQPLGITPDSAANLRFSNLVNYFENKMMANITGDEDFGLMSGDILKAYGNNIITLTSLGEEGGLLPVYDPYVLSQFKNAHVFNAIRRTPSGEPSTFNGPNTVQYKIGDLLQSTDGLLICAEQYDYSGALGFYRAAEITWLSARKLITVENPDPNPGDVLEATRLMPCLFEYHKESTGSLQDLIDCGTELAVGIIVTNYPNGVQAHGMQKKYLGSTVVHANFNTAPFLDMPSLLAFTHFKYMPVWYAFDYTEGTGDDPSEIKEFYPVGNLENTTLVTDDILRRLHEIAKLSLFYVPGVAKMIS